MPFARLKCRAIIDLSARPYWSELPREEQAREVEALARRLVLFESPIGKLAAAVSKAAGELADAYEDFLEQFPDSDAAIAAANRAFYAAGLSWKPGDPFGGDHFAQTPEIVRHLLWTLEHLEFPQLEHCDAPELLAG